MSGEWRQTFNFNEASGNLLTRSYMNGDSTFMKSENFQYDTRNRLTASQVTGQGQKVITYDETGNILTKADAGTYTYNSNNVNQLASVTFVRSGITTNTQIIAYNSQNKVTEMSEGNYSYDVMYGADGDRIRSRVYEDSILSKTKYYAPGYEKIIKSGSTIENHYIVSPYGLEAIIAKAGTSETLYLAETDHLGSLVGLFNTSGIHVEQYSYDAWGRRRNPADLTFINVPVPVITERGFTGHEHLDEFRLINMNGRLYDPLTGRFLNSDPVIDNTGGAQGLNSYSYVLNNPLKYIDPSGYIKAAPPEPGVILNPGWLRYAGYGHHSSSWFLQEFEAGKNGTGAEDRVKFEGILYDQETDTYVKGDGTPLSDEEILDYLEYLFEPSTNEEINGAGCDNTKTFCDPAPKQDFTGFWGVLKYFLTGGNIDGYQYDMDGDPTGYAPIMGMPPSIFGGPLRKGQAAIKLGKYLFNPSAFHGVKDGVLAYVNPKNYSHIVGTNPDLMFKGGKIWLTGTKIGGYFGKSYPTEMTIADFLKLF